jgi:hypothetical protein
MNLNKSLFAIELILLVTAVGCANTAHKTAETEKEKKETESRYINETTARETEAQNYLEIGFKEGSASLTENAKKSLNSVIEQARSKDKIDEVIVLSWSDQEYPSKNIKDLPKAQRELAEKRNKNIESYVKSMRDVDVNTYNMAERPTSFSKLFNTDDTKLKESMVSAGLSTTADTGDYVNRASRSVILIKVK